jgi:aspartate ammonia-lyase
MNKFRTECDLLGEIRVPANALYGAQTQRTVENFPPRNQPTLGGFPQLVNALASVKHATTSTNMAIGAILPKQGEAIQRAAEKVMQGKLKPF